jgi:nucleoside-diphosphate-sugar epimerase
MRWARSTCWKPRGVLPGIAVHPHVHQQGLRRPAQYDPAAGTGNPLGLCRPGLRKRHPEDFSIDQSKHSLFGASKVAGDVMVQEYGRYFNMPTCCLRGGCLTGPNHSGVELHGFLSYLIKCNVEGREYKVYGYKGKQVRDNIHSEDVARFMFEFWKAPRVAEVYNLGGGKGNACSILEAFRMAENVTGSPMNWRYVDENRIGDHICYYSDLRKMQAHYPAGHYQEPGRHFSGDRAKLDGTAGAKR